jgi:hypothetical protein
MILKPDFKMPFGINADFTLAEIYHYLPTYIEFLIEYVENFEINPKDFEDLPMPVTYTRLTSENATIEEKIKSALRIEHNGSVQKIKEQEYLRPYNYHFPEKVLNILHCKSTRVYITPIWKPKSGIVSIPWEELTKFIAGLN